jgi:HAMP domain-containing protein
MAAIFAFIIISVPLLVITVLHFGKKELQVTYVEGRNKIMSDTQEWSLVLTHLTFGALSRSMDDGDVDALQKLTTMAREQKDIAAVRIFSPEFAAGTNGKLNGILLFTGDTHGFPKEVKKINCGECHNSDGTLNQTGLALKPKPSMLDSQVRIDANWRAKNLQGNRSFDMIVHVFNQASCSECHTHPSTQKVDGVLQVNLSLRGVKKLLRRMKRRAERNEQRFKNEVIVWTLVCVVVLAAILLFIATGIVNKLAKLRYIAEQVSLGETNVTLDDIPPSADELGELRDSFERMLIAVKFFMMPEEEPEEPV